MRKRIAAIIVMAFMIFSAVLIGGWRSLSKMREETETVFLKVCRVTVIAYKATLK